MASLCRWKKFRLIIYITMAYCAIKMPVSNAKKTKKQKEQSETLSRNVPLTLEWRSRQYSKVGEDAELLSLYKYKPGLNKVTVGSVARYCDKWWNGSIVPSWTFRQHDKQKGLSSGQRIVQSEPVSATCWSKLSITHRCKLPTTDRIIFMSLIQ